MFSWKRRPLIKLSRVNLSFTFASTLLLAACGGGGGGSTGGGSSADNSGGDTPIESEARRQYTLTVALSGSGAVTSSPAGIDCGGDCSESYYRNTAVTLTATPASGYTFSGWSGGCSGSGGCTVSMTQASSITASFTATNTGSGGGTYQVSWDPVVDARVTGYKLYYSTAPLSSSGAAQTVSLGNVTSYRFNPASAGISTGATVYFAVAATGNGLESPLSDTVSAIIQ